MKPPQRIGFRARATRLFRHVGSPKSLPDLIWKNIKFPFTPQGAEQRYDRRFGIDTAGYIDPSKLGISAHDANRSLQYEATPPSIAEFLIKKVAPRTKDFTFLDVGSGKGRVLMIAAQFRFKRVVGVELSPMLHEIAGSNIRKFAGMNPVASPIEVYLGDATRLSFPDGPLVLFLYNPFEVDAVREFAASISSSFQSSPRKIICIYYNPVHADEFYKTGILPIRELINCPHDPRFRYSNKLQALILETLDQ